MDVTPRIHGGAGCAGHDRESSTRGRAPVIHGSPRGSKGHSFLPICGARESSSRGPRLQRGLESRGVLASEWSSDREESRCRGQSSSAPRGRPASGGAGRLPLAVSCPEVRGDSLERDEELIRQEVAVLEGQLRAEMSSGAWAAQPPTRWQPLGPRLRTMQCCTPHPEEDSHGLGLFTRPLSPHPLPAAHTSRPQPRTYMSSVSPRDTGSQVAQVCADLSETKRRLAWAKRRKAELEQLLELGSGARFCHACDVGTISLDSLLQALDRVCTAVVKDRSVPASAVAMLDEVAQALAEVAHLDPQASELADYLAKLILADNGASCLPGSPPRDGHSQVGIAWEVGK